MALIHGGPGLFVGETIQAGQHHGALGQLRHDGDQGGGGRNGTGGTSNDDGIPWRRLTPPVGLGAQQDIAPFGWVHTAFHHQ